MTSAKLGLGAALALAAALGATTVAAQSYGHERWVWTPDHLFAPSYGAGSGYVTGYSHGYAGVGSPLAEVDARAYARTGGYATGYSYAQPYGYAGYDYGYGYVAPTYTSHGYYRRDDYRRDDYRYAGGYNRYGYDRDYDRRYERRRDYRHDERRPGYRDRYGYQDDRPPVYDDGRRRGREHERHCYCEDAYRYDGY